VLTQGKKLKSLIAENDNQNNVPYFKYQL